VTAPAVTRRIDASPAGSGPQAPFPRHERDLPVEVPLRRPEEIRIEPDDIAERLPPVDDLLTHRSEREPGEVAVRS